MRALLNHEILFTFTGRHFIGLPIDTGSSSDFSSAPPVVPPLKLDGTSEAFLKFQSSMAAPLPYLEQSADSDAGLHQILIPVCSSRGPRSRGGSPAVDPTTTLLGSR